MLNENNIVSLLAEHLKRNGYKINQALLTHQQGIDIIAESTKHMLYIEAKGETSSKEDSDRYGDPFNNSQIISHVSRAILASMKILHDKPAGSKTKAGIALPDTPPHRDLVEKVFNPIKTLGIKVFFVSDKNVVEQ
ncbi:hypothetical protein A4D02_16145 [Niastella koreensis]|uniref:Restriction endonuclease type IV Mrr domain-containing protein n=2 Tax=Niastella koreensis TaxID=354356 RepID=G8TN55_NIAKG|nr:hypothetical protein [Niastella koreensis]AEV97740.1 hypothetical protein Niako_1369 [Niastella koreensis GR20-10]OQP40442.1 hypothetical protein A4D02_16145 [Niastella koreensis]